MAYRQGIINQPVNYKGCNDCILAIGNYYFSESCYKEFGTVKTIEINNYIYTYIYTESNRHICSINLPLQQHVS